MSVLKKIIKKSSGSLVVAFACKKKLDYSIESLRHIESFFDDQLTDGEPKAYSFLSHEIDKNLFALSSYLGEVFLHTIKGAVWITNDHDPEGEFNISIMLPTGIQLWPAQQIRNRMLFGKSEDIFVYAKAAVDKYFKTTIKEGRTPIRWLSFWKLFTKYFNRFGTDRKQVQRKDSPDLDLGEMMKKMFNTKIERDVDKDLFKQMGNGMYISENYNALLLTLAGPQSIETAAQHMEKQKQKDGYKKMSKGEYKVDGRRILFEKGRIKKNGKKMIIEMFAIESLPDTSIFLIRVHSPEHEDSLKSAL